MKKEELIWGFEVHLNKCKDEIKSLQVKLGPLKKEQLSYEKKDIINQIMKIEPKK